MTPAELHRAADAHGGRYLLPKWRMKEDAAYPACLALVESGHAAWIPFWSNMAPGIKLTAKPIETP